MTSQHRHPRPGHSKPPAPERRKPAVENDEYAAFARRVIRAYSRRIASGDIEAITAMAQLSRDLDAAIKTGIAGLRERGYSWADIGARLGVSRQAAQQRWGGEAP